MGTNYYMRYKDKTCECCKRTDEQYHIGKSSFGWTFSFRGYTNEFDTLQVKSFQDWKYILDDDNVFIIDEYEREISKEDFYKFVENKRYGLNHSIEHPQGNWIDNEGHSFSGSEFC